MPAGEIDTFIDRPPAEVFATLVDFSRGKRWQRGLLTLERLTPGPPGYGTRFHQVREVMGHRVDARWEIDTFKPGREIAVRSLKGSPPFKARYALEPEASGTRLRFRYEAELGGPFNPIAIMAGSAMKRQFTQDLKDLKELLEGKAAGS